MDRFITERRVNNPKGCPENLTGMGKGRPKGVPNVINRDIKEMILTALSELGGYKYLMEQGRKNPNAFMGLVGRVLPMQIAGHDGGPLVISFDMAGATAVGGPTAPMIDGVVEQIEAVRDAEVVAADMPGDVKAEPAMDAEPAD